MKIVALVVSSLSFSIPRQSHYFHILVIYSMQYTQLVSFPLFGTLDCQIAIATRARSVKVLQIRLQLMLQRSSHDRSSTTRGEKNIRI